MIGFLLMGIVAMLAVYMIFFKIYPALAFRYMGIGERKAKAEYQRVKREHPDAPEAKRSEAEFVEDFIRSGPSPWKYVIGAGALLVIGLPAGCTIGAATMMQ